MFGMKSILETTRLKQLMAKPVITIRETEEFHVVHQKMEEHDIRHLPVVDDAGVLVGLFTERYLYKLHSPRKLDDGGWYYDQELLDGFILKNVMIKEPYTLKAESSLKEAMQVMSQLKFGCVVVVDDYRMPCGMVTFEDILQFLLTK